MVLVALCYAGWRGVGAAPPLGQLLDPANGVWALARTAEFPAHATARIPGLGAAVRVLYDERGVPHVFAASEEDAWRAEGYLVARDRLFQLELQTRAAAGTLSELLGARALEADRAARQRGFRWAAERELAGLDSGSLIARATRAYAQGVNAWIGGLTRAELPLEYRLLHSLPAAWRPIDTFYFFLQMGYTLAWDEATLERSRAREAVGAAAAEALFPLNSPIQEPIQPNGQRAPRYDFLPHFPPPAPPESLRGRAVAAATGSFRSSDAIGSNNWVVAPKRTAAGYALLAGDPHLELSLPSVWYEIHLQVAGGGLDVAGVTFPGAPGVIIGFNRDVAWSFTNTGADVRDHYRETVDDDAHPARYRLDGVWKPLQLSVETVRGRRGEILAVDTVRFTHRGPLARSALGWISQRWTVYEAQRPGEDFLRLDRAHSVAEWLEGWKDYVAAAQNGVAADRAGHIAIRSTGRYPVRPGDGRGDEVRDGSSSASDWSGFLPLAAYPFALDPPQGYLASANQQPVDPRANPHYFGSNWYSPWRALRLNQLLRSDSAVTPEAMRKLQTDPGSARADAFVPLFLAAARAAESAGQGSPALERAAMLLAQWDKSYTRGNARAVLFESAMAALPPLVWDELPGERERDGTVRRRLPEEAVLLELAADSLNPWWDRQGTSVVEHRDAVLAEALRVGYLRAVHDHGPPDEDGWRWGNAHHANLYHLLRIPGLSALNLPVQGGPSTLSPSPWNGTHGPSWRMVVETGPALRAWAIYPGGQSGNPASARYLDRLPHWLAGQLDTVRFPANPQELPRSSVRAELLLTPDRR